MYEIYNDLKKIADECMDVTESYFLPNGDCYFSGQRDGKTVCIILKQVES